MSDSKADIENRLRQVFAQCTTESSRLDEIGSEGALADATTGLDSVTLLEFVIGIENEFSILLDDGSLTPEHFETLGTLAVLVQTKIEEQFQS